MPIISMFYGIIIRMFCSPSEHNPPHFHAQYQNFKAILSLDGELLAGELPKRQMHYVVTWAMLHHDELVADWELAMEGAEVYKIDPLR